MLPAGVIFRRDALLSVGGLAAGETVGGIDYLTSCRLLGAGFSSMYIDEQLVFDMAPLELAGEGPGAGSAAAAAAAAMMM